MTAKKSGAKKSGKKRGVIISCVILAAVIVGGGWMVSNARVRMSSARASSAEEYKVTRGDIAVSAHGTGTIAFVQTDPVYAPLTAKVSEVTIKNGDVIKKGEPIARLDGKDLDKEITKLENNLKNLDQELSATRSANGSSSIYSPVEGRVKAIYAQKNDDISMVMNKYGALALLSTDGRMKMTVDVGTAAAPEVGTHLDVQIEVDGKTKTEDGQVTQVDGSKLTIVIRSDRYDVDAEATAVLEEKELGKGKLEINSPLPIIAQSGTISYVNRSVGAYVYSDSKLFGLKGDVITQALSQKIDARAQAKEDLDEQLAKRELLTIVAPYDAVISELSIIAGQPIQENALICRTNETGRFQLVVAVDELDISNIALGQSATVKIDALPGQRFAGTVSRISSLGTAGNGVTTYDVTVDLTEAKGVLSSMTASADIHTSENKDTLLTKLETVFSEGDQHYVWKLTPNAEAGTTPYQRVDVTIGLTNDEYIEIRSGVSEGDALTVPSSGMSGMPFMGGGNGGSGGGMRIVR